MTSFYRNMGLRNRIKNTITMDQLIQQEKNLIMLCFILYSATICVCC